MDETINYGLHEYLDELQTKVNQVGAGIHDTFFAFKTPESLKRPVREMAQSQ